VKRFLVLLLAGCGGAAPPAAKVAPPAPAVPTTKPAAPPADEAARTDGDVTVARVHGLAVLVKRVPGAELVAADLFIRGGVRNWSDDDAGVEELAVRTSASGGTAKLDRDAFARRLAELGSTINAEANEDYSAFAAKTLLPNWDATFELFVDAFRRPALPDGEIELQRRLLLSELRHEQEDPDARLQLLLHQTVFKGQPYARRAVGTLETVAKLSKQQLVDHLAKLRDASRLFLVVVGDVDPAHVIDQVQNAFGDLPIGAYVETPLPPLHFDKASLTVAQQKLPTNYITAIFPGPAWKDADFPAALVAMRVLNHREFEEVRTKRNLSYAPQAYFRTRTAIPYGAVYVTAVDPKTTVKVLLDEARRLQTEPVPLVELDGYKAELLTTYYLQNESTDAQALLLGDAQLRGGDWHFARTLLDRVKSVTAADVETFAQRYIGRLQAFVLGDPKLVDDAMFSSP
jgi:zinc protease